MLFLLICFSSGVRHSTTHLRIHVHIYIVYRLVLVNVPRFDVLDLGAPAVICLVCHSLGLWRDTTRTRMYVYKNVIVCVNICLSVYCTCMCMYVCVCVRERGREKEKEREREREKE